MSRPQYWFRSTLFEIEPGEEDETNPLCYGRQLANWLRRKLIAKGYGVEEVFGEDWGWCVVCARKPFMLWVGCVNVHDYAKSRPEDPPPSGKDVTWTCIVEAELPIFSRLFKRMETGPAVQKLYAEVGTIL